MNLETSKKILRIVGILTIIGAVFMLVLGVLALLGGGTLATEPDIETNEELQQTLAGAFLGGFLFVFVGIISLIEGIVSYRAGKTGRRGLATAAMIFGALGVFSNISNLFTGAKTSSSIVSNVISIALSILGVYAAYVVRKSATE